MHKLTKILLAILVVLVAIYIIVVVALKFFIDPNTYKALITKKVKESTGMTLTIQGDIGLRLFPWLAFSADQIQLSNPEGFTNNTQKANIASIQHLSVSVALWPLFTGNVQPKTITIKQAQFNLITNAKGQSNWDIAQSGLKNEPKKATAGTQKPEAKKPHAFAIPNVEISDANVSYIDNTKNTTL